MTINKRFADFTDIPYTLQVFLLSLPLPELITWVAVLVISLSVHEAAHAAMAYLLGDSTAHLEGRLTLNPAKHLDPIGALFLVFVGFGWGRPVPVNPRHFTHPNFFQALTALAGPLSNLLLAIIFLFLLAYGSGFFLTIASIGIHLNILLAVFNLLPIPPLDGGSLIRPFLPYSAAEKYEALGPLLLFGTIAFDSVFGTRILASILSPLVTAVETILRLLA